MSAPLRCISLLGATGTGKTAAAFAFAKEFPITVINLDSRQVYADLEIVTAQPSAEERALCPHLLYGYLPVTQSVRAGAFAELLREKAFAVHAQGRVPVFVGGTGLYLRAFTEGLAPIPDIDPSVRARILEECRQEGSAALYARLQSLDPLYAAKIHPNDPQRICRALEVYTGTGRRFSDWHRQTEAPKDVQVLKIGLQTTLEALTPRLDLRIEAMLLAGAEEEVAQAYAKHPRRDAPGFSGIGCPELLAMLLDGLPREEARVLWLRNTRAYAKRQLTWFRKEALMQWFDVSEIEQGVRQAARFLEKKE